MSRPIKQGLDYFPMDVTTDDKFELIEAKHGLVGFGIIIKLYQKIYKEGCYLKWSDDKLLIFKKNINEDINLITAVINDAIVYNVFDKKIHQKYGILTSCGIQKRFFSACDRRKSIELVKNYIIVDIKEVNVNINWINEDNSTQSKVKESKVKDTNKTWRTDFDTYIIQCRAEYAKVYHDLLFIEEQGRLNPEVNIKLSIEKGYVNFWGKECGWKHKKKSQTADIDWTTTIVNSISKNKVYYTKEELSKFSKL